MELILILIGAFLFGRLLRFIILDAKKTHAKVERENLKDQNLCPPHQWERIEGKGLVCKRCKVEPEFRGC